MKKAVFFFLILAAALLTAACGAGVPAEEVPSAEYTGSMDLQWAKAYTVDYYSDGSALISIEGDEFLLVPEGQAAPTGVGEDPVLLRQPLENIYLVSSSTMDMFLACDALNSVRYCALEESGWYLPEARQAMEEGSLVYAGKYSAPDYETLTAGKCSLAIENTMILHSPEVAEKLETLGIPVLVDHSSYEDTPQGRMEWVKLYGLLTGHLPEAEEAFQDQMAHFDALSQVEDTGKTVAFFYVTTTGTVSVRRDTDYIPKMISLAGGDYVYEGYGVTDDSSSPTVSLQMETFYAAAKDADILIYNSSIAGSITTLRDLIGLNSLFSSFRAVKSGNVYCTEESLYQSPMEMGEFVSDLSSLLHGDDSSLHYIFRLK